MNYRFGKLNVPEMPGALACFLVAGLASEPWVDDAKVKIHESLRVRKSVVIVSIRPDDFPYTHLSDLFWG
jgi:hypothetical protein